ncbi:restriction endonuclease [Kitasatospora sp. NPDC058965]|uniref:restriction endonuclease n=1 Tax=Kitasatospora sp. NPDC058965 TaxID=3346682 RepID=UPI00367F1385
MAVDAVLLESPTMRARVGDRVEALDKVRALTLLPDGVHVTTEGVAAYFEVSVKTIRSVVLDHGAELGSNGYTVLTGERLGSFKELSRIHSRARALALFTRRTVLNVAMLLRDSDIARQVRSQLLDIEERARYAPVDNRGVPPVDNLVGAPAGSVDAAVARVAETVVSKVIGTAVVPLLNAIAEDVAHSNRKLDVLTDRVDRLERIVLDDDQRSVARRRLQLLRAVDEGVDEELLDDHLV